MRKPINIGRYLLSLALAALTTVTILASVHVASAQDQAAPPSWTAATALSTLRGNGKIAFTDVTSDGQSHSGISVMNPDGSGRSQLTSSKIVCPAPNLSSGCGPDQVDYSPAWSPDGNQIAFIRSVPPSYTTEVFVMNADGSNQRRLTLLGGGSPAWSPDGTKLAFTVPAGQGDNDSQVYVVNIDGSGVRRIGPGYDPAWSPDGSKLAVSSYLSFTYRSVIFLMNPDGSGRAQITSPPAPTRIFNYDFRPVWSPDGTRILFLRSIGCDYDENCESTTVWTVNADGSNPAKLTDINAYNGLAWSPDGTKILVSADGDLFTIDADGSNVTRVTNTPSQIEAWPSWQPVALAQPDNNPINDAQFFVRQHYRDFLNRDPDPDGLAFWTNEILLCGGDAGCIEAKRINVSAAYFLSIEFQQSGYLVYRTYKAAYGNLPGAPVPIRFNEFLPDTQQIGHGVVVNQPGWETLLENNKQAFMSEFVQRPRFVTAFPVSMAPAQFVDTLFANAGVTPSSTDRAAAINEFGGTLDTSEVAARARALRRVAENPALQQQEFNRAFVLMQYFGYLRRNPNDAPEVGLNFDGYNFWLNKLNSFNGNFQDAEMVKAFLVSAEYRQRFGP